MTKEQEIARDRIWLLLVEHSGGMKFTELIADFMQQCYEADDLDVNDRNLPDFLLSVIERMPRVGVLTYVMPIGDLEREKMFIHIKPHEVVKAA